MGLSGRLHVNLNAPGVGLALTNNLCPQTQIKACDELCDIRFSVMVLT